MSELRRYGMVRGESGAGMFWIGECSDGEYVLRAGHEAELSALRALVARQHAELKRLEWRDGTRFVGEGVPIQCCPSCQSVMFEEGQHCDDCELDALLASPSAQATEEWLREREWQLVRRALEEIEVRAIRLRNDGYKPGASYSRAISEKLETFAVPKEVPHVE